MRHIPATVVAAALVLAGCAGSPDPTSAVPEGATGTTIAATGPTVTSAATREVPSVSRAIEGASTTTILPASGTESAAAPTSSTMPTETTTTLADIGTSTTVSLPTAPRPDPAADFSVSLTVEYGTIDEPRTGRADLSCSGADSVGTDYLGPTADLACARLADAPVLEILLAPRPANVACAGVFGGADLVHVSGSIDDAEVDRQLDRSDGCGIDEWDTLTVLLPPLADLFTLEPDGG